MCISFRESRSFPTSGVSPCCPHRPLHFTRGVRTEIGSPIEGSSPWPLTGVLGLQVRLCQRLKKKKTLIDVDVPSQTLPRKDNPSFLEAFCGPLFRAEISLNVGLVFNFSSTCIFNHQFRPCGKTKDQTRKPFLY